MKPTLILGRVPVRFKTKHGMWRRVEGYKCDNGKEYRSLQHICEDVTVTYHTAAARANRYGITSRLVLYEGKINRDAYAELGVKEPVSQRELDEYPKSVCIREGDLCINWSDRLGQRLGLEGAGGNCNPKDTDKCYRSNKETYYNSPLVSTTHNEVGPTKEDEDYNIPLLQNY